MSQASNRYQLGAGESVPNWFMDCLTNGSIVTHSFVERSPFDTSPNWGISALVHTKTADVVAMSHDYICYDYIQGLTVERTTELYKALKVHDRSTPGPWYADYEVIYTENSDYIESHGPNDCWVFGDDVMAKPEDSIIAGASWAAISWIKRMLPILEEDISFMQSSLRFVKAEGYPALINLYTEKLEKLEELYKEVTK